MEYLGGGNLSEFHINGDFQLLIKIAQQIASALTYLHSMDIIHRDVKLANIMLDEFGNIRLVDFDVSIFKWRIPEEKRSLIGTACYMAP